MLMIFSMNFPLEVLYEEFPKFEWEKQFFLGAASV